MSRAIKIPRTAKRFASWRNKQPAMPVDLALKADDAQAAHDLLAMNKNSKDFPAIKARYWPRVIAFEDAHAAREKSR